MQRHHVFEGLDYAEKVAAGVLPAAKPLKAACQRQLRDLDRWKSPDSPFRFDERKAARVCQFVEAMPHIKGEWAKNRGTITLQPWQAFILSTIFGWIKVESGMRRFRQVYIEVPRKNAKSTLTSAVALFMLALDGEEGAELYSAGTTRDQAGIVFRDSMAMVNKSPEFRKAFNVSANSLAIFKKDTNSRYMALSSQDHRLDGLNPHFSMLDEVHAMNNRGLYDVLDTAMAARSQPMLWMITTAGNNMAGVCYEQHKYTLDLVYGTHTDESYFGIVYTIDNVDHWTEEVEWIKANPNYGVSVKKDELRDKCNKAVAVPNAQNAFLTKRLNVWVNADAAWMNMLAWNRCGDSTVTVEDFVGRECYIGMDLASRSDLCAVVLLFPLEQQRIAIFGRYYLPDETVKRMSKQYSGWEREGRLIATEGAMTDQEAILIDLMEFARRFQVRALCYDPWQSVTLEGQLQKLGFTVPLIKLENSTRNLSAPMKEFEALVLDGRVLHDGDPVMTWMMSNVVCHYDARDNVFPRKERQENKIDGPMAVLYAMNRYLIEYGRSCVYEERGLIAI
jgi:phage terminase large subunit-like protein